MHCSASGTTRLMLSRTSCSVVRLGSSSCARYSSMSRADIPLILEHWEVAVGRRSLDVANLVEVLEDWAAGRSLRAIAFSLGLDRNTDLLWQVRQNVWFVVRPVGVGKSHRAEALGHHACRRV